MSEEIRYKISYDQSVSTGIIGFHGSIEFTDGEGLSNKLLAMLQVSEEIFRDAGYKVASDIKPKEPKEK